MNNTDKPSSSNNEKLKFFDEEYPTLDEKKSKSKTLSNTILSKSKEKCLESGSEWETEDENEFLISKNLIEGAAANLENEIVPQIIQNEETGPVNKSYSSILKSLSNKKSAGKVRKSSNPVINELSDELIKAKSVSKNKNLILLPASNSSTLLTKPDVKKVKKKDPIKVDIFEAAKVKKKIENVHKPSVVHGSKIKKTGGNVDTITTPQVRNVLEASASTKRRGKKREKPKRKSLKIDHKCEQCGKSFSLAKNLKRHIRSAHEDHKNYECEQCGRNFTMEQTLRRHFLTIHEKQNIVQCDKCDKYFSRKQYLKEHIRSVHEGHEDFKCPSCGKSFSQQGVLKRHLYTVHEGHKDFKCEFCKKSFSQKVFMKKHIQKVHEGEKSSKK